MPSATPVSELQKNLAERIKAKKNTALAAALKSAEKSIGEAHKAEISLRDIAQEIKTTMPQAADVSLDEVIAIVKDIVTRINGAAPKPE